MDTCSNHQCEEQERRSGGDARTPAFLTADDDATQPAVLLAEKLAMFVHRFHEFPADLLPAKLPDHQFEKKEYCLWRDLFLEWTKDIFLEDDLGKKKEIILNDFKHEEQKGLRQEAFERAHQVWSGIVNYAGGFYLHHLDDKVQTEQEIRAIIQCVPEALSCCEKKHENQGAFFLPIHSAINHYSINGCDIEVSGRNFSALSFVPVLLEEGIKYDIPIIAGSRNSDFEKIHDSRGGLLSKPDLYEGEEFEDTMTLLFGLEGYSCEDSEECIILRIFDRLRQVSIIRKEDIRNHSILYWIVNGKKMMLLERIVDWDPDVLKETDCMHHYALLNIPEFDRFEIMLKIALQFFCQELGLLLLKHRNTHDTVISQLYERRGKNATWDILKRAFAKADLRKLLGFNEEMGMFPFLLAAEGDLADLNLVYYLMRKDPVIWNIYP